MPTRTRLDCRVCHCDLKGASRFQVYITTRDAHIWGPVGPTCARCMDFAIERRERALRVEETNPDGTSVMLYYPGPNE